jgi:hypothetical protein
MCPVLVEMVRASNLPTASVRQVPDFREVSNLDSRKRDDFFKHIVVTQDGDVAQINQILIGRIMLYIKSREPSRGKDNLTMSQRDMLRLTIDETKDFSRFFDDQKKRKGSIAQMQKLLRPHTEFGHTDKAKAIFKAAEINESKWGRRGVGEIFITTYDDAIEMRMHQLLQEEDKTAAMRYAQKGYITNEFLVKLLEAKEKYNDWRQRKKDHSAERIRASLDILEDTT